MKSVCRVTTNSKAKTLLHRTICIINAATLQCIFTFLSRCILCIIALLCAGSCVHIMQPKYELVMVSCHAPAAFHTSACWSAIDPLFLTPTLSNNRQKKNNCYLRSEIYFVWRRQLMLTTWRNNISSRWFARTYEAIPLLCSTNASWT